MEKNKYVLTWEEQAKVSYAKDSERKRNKAIAAGRAIDNALKDNRKKSGETNCYFKADVYLKYFSWDALGIERVKLLLYASD